MVVAVKVLETLVVIVTVVPSGKKECGEKCCVITESKQQVGGGPCFR